MNPTTRILNENNTLVPGRLFLEKKPPHPSYTSTSYSAIVGLLYQLTKVGHRIKGLLQVKTLKVQEQHKYKKTQDT